MTFGFFALRRSISDSLPQQEEFEHCFFALELHGSLLSVRQLPKFSEYLFMPLREVSDYPRIREKLPQEACR